MASIQPFSNGTRWDRVLRYAVGGLYLLFPLVYVCFELFQGRTPDSGMFFIVLGLSLVSAYLYFGKENVQEALGDAGDLNSNDEG